MAHGIIDCKGTETRQIFSGMFVMAKKIKELIASTLNRITASVKCVSSMIVVLNAKLTRLIARNQKKTVRNDEARQECRFLLVETHKH